MLHLKGCELVHISSQVENGFDLELQSLTFEKDGNLINISGASDLGIKSIKTCDTIDIDLIDLDDTCNEIINKSNDRIVSGLFKFIDFSVDKFKSNNYSFVSSTPKERISFTVQSPIKINFDTNKSYCLKLTIIKS